MTNAPDTLDELRRDLTRALRVIEDRTDDYIAAKEYYEGKRAEYADSKAAEAVIRQTERTPVSFAHIPVDVVADKVALSSITAPDANAKRALESWMLANDIDDESVDWIRKACIFGDYYVVTDPTGLDENGAFTVEDIDSVGMSPLSTVVIYDKKTGRKAIFGAHFWDAGTKERPQTRAALYYNDFTVKLIADGANASDAADFDLDYDPSAGEEPVDAYLEHDGDKMLIAHLAVGGKPYGVPIHKKAWGFQDAITKISANNLINVDSLGLPPRWALMDPAAEIDDDIDDDFGTDGPTTAPSPDGQRGAVNGLRTRTVPGAIQYLRGVKQTGTYDGAETSGFLANQDWYIRGMAVATGIALHEFDMKGDQPSGESRRRAEGRQNRIAASVKRQAGAFFRELAETVLGLVGASGEVAVTFNPSETSTDKDGLELVAIKAKSGVPLRQALLEAGYTDTQVEEWYPKDAPALSVETLGLIAEALGKLGNALALGAVTDVEVAAMLPDILTDARGEGPQIGAATVLEGVVTNPGTVARRELAEA